MKTMGHRRALLVLTGLGCVLLSGAVLAWTTVLSSGATMDPNTSVSGDGCDLWYQGDGNLVLYCGTAVWSTQTDGKSAGFTAMQTDGNLVVYDGNSNPVWDSQTNGHYGAYAGIANNKLYIYSTGGTELWDSDHPPAWFPDWCNQYLEEGLAAYNNGHPDVMCNDFYYIMHGDGNPTPSRCANMYRCPEVQEIENTCSGHSHNNKCTVFQ